MFIYKQNNELKKRFLQHYPQPVTRFCVHQLLYCIVLYNNKI